MKGPPANKQRVQTGDKSRWKQLKILVLGDAEKLPDRSTNREKRLLFVHLGNALMGLITCLGVCDT